MRARGLHTSDSLWPPTGLSQTIVRAEALLYALLGLMTCTLSVLHGPWRQSLTVDNSWYIYMAQRILDGVAPYVSAHDRKTPLVFLLDAAVLFVARPFNIPDVFSTRAAFVVLSGLAVTATCLAGASIYSTCSW